jgi:anti-anti-sigma regulatory factor
VLKITRAVNGEVVIKLSGRMDAENLAELETLITSEADGRRIVLDLRDLTLVDQDAVSFLKRCEADNITLKNCPAYIRVWILREQKIKPNQ